MDLQYIKLNQKLSAPTPKTTKTEKPAQPQSFLNDLGSVIIISLTYIKGADMITKGGEKYLYTTWSLLEEHLVCSVASTFNI